RPHLFTSPPLHDALPISWQVTFTTDHSGAPAIIINQPKLAIANLEIVFAGETTTNAPGTVAFDFPEKPMPFGKVKFEDLTYLPGDRKSTRLNSSHQIISY